MSTQYCRCYGVVGEQTGICHNVFDWCKETVDALMYAKYGLRTVGFKTDLKFYASFRKTVAFFRHTSFI